MTIGGRPIRASKGLARGCIEWIARSWSQKARRIDLERRLDARAAYVAARLSDPKILEESAED